MFDQVASSRASQPARRNRRQHSTSIHILGDNLLLKIFHLCRPVLSDEDDVDNNRSSEGRNWNDHRWWYNIAHVGRKWRYLVLESAPNLGLCLVCTYGTPVADVLASSPPFPIIIDYGDQGRELTAQDEEGISLALRRRRRVLRVRLRVPASNLRQLVAALDGEFPMLGYLYIKPTDDKDLVLPESFKAPHLRYFSLRNITHSPGMFHVSPPTPPIRPDGVRRYAEHPWTQIWRSLRIFIHILDDDSLLGIFYHCRLVLIDEDETDEHHVLRGGHWDRERWWYKLTHVCRRWRYLVLASASYLDLCIPCTYGTPIADVLAHSPSFPLIIDFLDEHHDITTADEEGILLALQQRHRVRRIRLRMFVPTLLKFVVAFDGEFPMLEHLFLRPPNKVNTILVLPGTFQAPHMHHLVLNNFALPASPLLTTAVGLVTLSLMWIHPSAYFHPSELLQRLSLFPQLKILRISFQSPISNRDIERHLLDTPIMTHVTLPNLRWFSCFGPSAYLEALVHRVTAPSLEKLQTWFFNQLTYSIPNLVQFTITNGNLRSTRATIVFSRETAFVKMYPHEADMMRALYMETFCRDLDWQVSSMVQILNALSPVFSSVEHLTLTFEKHSLSSNRHSEIDDTQWRGLLRPFSHVTILQVDVDDKLARVLSHALQLVDGEPPMGLLPELKELQYFTRRVSSNSFEAFIDARKEAGQPLTLVGLQSRLIQG